MKTLKHSLSLFALMIVILCCNQSSVQKSLITVQDYRNQQQPKIDLESHKTGDVEIRRVILSEEGYEIIYYHDNSGKIQDYHAFYIDTINYNQGSYNWKNDTTVTVKLFNSETKQEWNVEFFISGDSSYMRLID